MNLLDEKPWEPPVEVFIWNNRISIRDKNRRNVFYMEIDGREYWKVRRLREKIAPLVAELLNGNSKAEEYYKNNPDDIRSFHGKSLPEILEANGEKAVRNPWGRAGKPKA